MFDIDSVSVFCYAVSTGLIPTRGDGLPVPGSCSFDVLLLPTCTAVVSSLSCLFYFRVSPHCKQKPTNPKTFELQNENFKLGQELEESDTQLYECGTTVGGREGGGDTEREGTAFRGVTENGYTVRLA